MKNEYEKIERLEREAERLEKKRSPRLRGFAEEIRSAINILRTLTEEQVDYIVIGTMRPIDIARDVNSGAVNFDGMK